MVVRGVNEDGVGEDSTLRGSDHADSRRWPRAESARRATALFTLSPAVISGHTACVDRIIQAGIRRVWPL